VQLALTTYFNVEGGGRAGLREVQAAEASLQRANANHTNTAPPAAAATATATATAVVALPCASSTEITAGAEHAPHSARLRPSLSLSSFSSLHATDTPPPRSPAR
jgi:hypothetical protein